MALTKLNVFKDRSVKKRPLEPEDMRQAFVRAAKNRWGNDCPLEVKSVRNGVLRVQAPSAPWRAELNWAAQEMVENINAMLGLEAIKKIIVWWG